MRIGVHPDSNSPLARKLRAQFGLRRVVPVVELPPKPSKRVLKEGLCERFASETDNFREIRLLRAGVNLARFQVPDLGEPYRWTAREIIKAVAAKHGLTPHDLLCAGRIKRLVLARHEAAYEMARLTTLSLPQMGKILGGRDHTTILNAIRKHAERYGLPAVRGLEPKGRGR